MRNYIVKVKLLTGKVVMFGFRAMNRGDARLISIDMFGVRVMSIPKEEVE